VLRKSPKLKEISPGETRTVCLICETPIGSRAFFCEEHKEKRNTCEKCGKATMSKVLCADCRKRKSEEEPILLSSAQIRGGKRVLTEADRPFVEKWWAEGIQGPAIAKKLGLTTNTPTGAIIARRRKDWQLPYRNESAIKQGRAIGGRKSG
jgi:hypothetical protein